MLGAGTLLLCVCTPSLFSSGSLQMNERAFKVGAKFFLD